MSNNLSITISVDRWRVYIQSWSLFVGAICVSLALASGDTTLVPPIIPSLLVFIKYLCVLMCLIVAEWRKVTMSSILLIIIALTVGMLNFFDHSEFSEAKPTVLGLLLMLTVALSSKDSILKAFTLFRTYMIIMCIASIVVSVAFILQLPLPYEVVDYYGTNCSAFYFNYYISYIYMAKDANEIFRCCGLFNEPGYLGTFLSFFICLERCKINWQTSLMFITGCFTLSMAFFAILILGIFLFRMTNITRIIAATLMVSLVFMGSLVEFENEFVKNIMSRFKYNEQTGKMEGDNRTDEVFEHIQNDFYMDSSNLLFGKGTSYCNDMGSIAVGIKRNIVEWGFLGTALAFLLYIYVGVKESKGIWSVLFFIFCFTMSVYQRSYIFALDYMIIFFGGILYLVRIFEEENTQLNIINK